MDYWIDRDWGAAIINTGIITCTDCSFFDNYAKNGGAIFNQGLLMIENCHFWGNDAYGKGDDICVGDGGSVYIDGVQITENNTHKLVCFAESMSEGLTALITLGSFVVSFTLGCIIAAFTLNPALGFAAAVAAGAAIGAAVGAVIGTATAAWLISTHYDVNYNRAKVLATLIVGDALIGAAGGMAGGYLGISATDVIDEIYFDYEYYHPLLLCGESIGTVFAGLLIGMISLL